MVNTINFVLPHDKTMASIHVRGLCLDGFAPQGWEFDFISIDTSYSKHRVLQKVKIFYQYALAIGRIRLKKRGKQVLYFIKPNSILLMALCRFIYRYKVFIDINDPIHLPEHAGRFSREKLIIMLNLANGTVFESTEYKEYTRILHSNPATVIEDTPQFEISFINLKNRNRNVVWFGSPATSRILINYKEYFKKFISSGFSITLLGADVKTTEILSESGIKCNAINVYTHELLLSTLSNSILAFVPMPNEESYSLRGNLKAKFAMASGCVTIASDLNMHRRLIEDNVTGFIFSNFSEFSVAVDNISRSPDYYCERIGGTANVNVINLFNRISHAEKICKFVNSCN